MGQTTNQNSKHTKTDITHAATDDNKQQTM